MKKLRGSVILLLVSISALLLSTATIIIILRASDTPDSDYILYSTFGAVGDGVTDDFDALIAAHNAANAQGKKVKADPDKTYYLGNSKNKILVKTDVDWGNAHFIIDDTNIALGGDIWRRGIFQVQSSYASTVITNTAGMSLHKDDTTIVLPQGYSFERNSLIVIEDSTTVFSRDPGSDYSKQDVLVVDKDGNIDPDTKLIWEFDTITKLTVYPIDEETITLTGGTFTTKAHSLADGLNPASSSYAILRGLRVERSNVVVDGVTHYVVNETDRTPQYDFLSVAYCANVTVKNTALTARRYNGTGTYDSCVGYASNIKYINVTQTNDLVDPLTWGITGTSFIKNFLFESVSLNRIDVHRDVYNFTIRNSIVGDGGIRATGGGLLLVENTVVYASRLIWLRDDYGGYWFGDIIIRNCELRPNVGSTSLVCIIGGRHHGTFDFGHDCSLPTNVTVDGLFIDATGIVYHGASIFEFFKVYTPGGPESWTHALGKPEIVTLNNIEVLLPPLSNPNSWHKDAARKLLRTSPDSPEFFTETDFLTIDGEPFSFADDVFYARTGDRTELTAPTLFGNKFTYTGNEQGPTITGSTEGLAITKSRAVNAGNYTMTVKIADRNTHCWAGETSLAVITYEWSIAKAERSCSISINDWIVGQQPNSPEINSPLSDNPLITYYYSSSASGPWIQTVPETTGTWYVRGYIAATTNYSEFYTAAESFEIAEAPVVITYTVSFLNEDSTPYHTENDVEHGLLVTKPADPSKENYIFRGWYIYDTETKWDFYADVVTSDIVLVARWEENSTDTPKLTFLEFIQSSGGIFVIAVALVFVCLLISFLRTASKKETLPKKDTITSKQA